MCNLSLIINLCSDCCQLHFLNYMIIQSGFQFTELMLYADIWCFLLSFFDFFCMPCMEYEAVINLYLMLFEKIRYFGQ